MNSCRLNKWIIVIFALLLVPIGCRPRYKGKLLRGYHLYHEGPFQSGYYLMCQLGCSDDIPVDELEYVEWSNSAILVSRKSGVVNISEWYAIYNDGDPVDCCQGNKPEGPMTQAEIIEYKNKISFTSLGSYQLIPINE